MCWVQEIEVDNPAVLLGRVLVENHTRGPVVVAEGRDPLIYLDKGRKVGRGIFFSLF